MLSIASWLICNNHSVYCASTLITAGGQPTKPSSTCFAGISLLLFRLPYFHPDLPDPEKIINNQGMVFHSVLCKLNNFSAWQIGTFGTVVKPFGLATNHKLAILMQRCFTISAG